MTNGIIYIDGRPYMQCGAALIPIRYLDKQDKAIKPKEAGK